MWDYPPHHGDNRRGSKMDEKIMKELEDFNNLLLQNIEFAEQTKMYALEKMKQSVTANLVLYETAYKAELEQFDQRKLVSLLSRVLTKEVTLEEAIELLKQEIEKGVEDLLSAQPWAHNCTYALTNVSHMWRAEQEQKHLAVLASALKILDPSAHGTLSAKAWFRGLGFAYEAKQ
jgi:hypothetical protein